MKSERFLSALERKPVDCTPIWIMRQAGRYLPEYRATRAKAGDFLKLCKTPELACEVTLQPVDRFDLDAAILFSDILTVPDAMGLGLSVDEGVGPRFLKPVRSKEDVDRLTVPDPETELRYVLDTIRLVRAELCERIPLIGFAGSPWTLMTYMVEGQSSRDFSVVKKLIFDQPETAHQLLNTLTQSVVTYLSAQVKAGAQALMVFDTWGGVLTTRDYDIFSLNYMQRIIKRLDEDLKGGRPPLILFTKGGGQWLENIAATGCEGVGLDWTVDIKQARQRVGDRVSLQGNMDPNILYASEGRIVDEVRSILHQYGRGSGHVFNLGHGIHPSVDHGRIKILVDAVHELSMPYHG